MIGAGVLGALAAGLFAVAALLTFSPGASLFDVARLALLGLALWALAWSIATTTRRT